MEPKLTLELEPLAFESPPADARAEPSRVSVPADPPVEPAVAATPLEPVAPMPRREDLGRFLDAATRELEARNAKGPSAASPAASPPASRPASARPVPAKAANAEVLPRRAAFKVDFRSPGVLAAAAAVALLLIGGGYWVLGDDADSAAPTVASAPKASKSSSATAHPAAARAEARDAPPVDDGLHARIAKVRDVGNWNVFVLLCTEWTRREPANPVAWLQLSDGYMKLQQYSEALEAATHASQLAPTDAGAWRHLGSVHVALDRYDDALRDYRQAVALDGHDVATLNRVGDIATRLGQYADAHAAYGQALALYPDDVDAACGQAFATRQQGLAKDADAIEKGLAAREHSCTDWKSRHPSEPSQATSYRTVKPARGG
jgi:tetratricopeptide (TPR) repeat protein